MFDISGVKGGTSKGYQQLEMSTHSVSDIGAVTQDDNEDLDIEDSTENQTAEAIPHSPGQTSPLFQSSEQVRQRHLNALRLQMPNDEEADPSNNHHNNPSSPHNTADINTLTYSIFNRDVKEILDGITKQQTMMLVILFILSTIVLINLTLLINTPTPVESNPSSDLLSYTNEGSFNAKTIAFGSCSSYDLRDMTIFTDAIIPAKPDAWIWTGDFVYLDDSNINCEIYQASQEWQESCNCTATWFASPPYSCHAGDVNYAKQRWLKGISNGPYQKFLDYMCPNSLAKGEFPPNGASKLSCTKPIYGIYDDHDFGGNNANGREQDKFVYKQMYLDAIGVPQTHSRRNQNRGAWYKHTLNAGDPDLEVDIILLDERYERMSAPCDVRREYCEKVVFSGLNVKPVTASERVWCEDFLQKGPVQMGSCCKKDEELFFKWCLQADSPSSPYYREICDVTYEEFGMRSFRILPNGEVALASSADAIDDLQGSSFCDVLGRTQRKWLRQTIKESTAAITLFVSSSVLFSNPTPLDCGAYYKDATKQEVLQAKCRCSTDDWDCYRVAQQEMMYLMSSVPGCSIVVTGDFHYSDIKQLVPAALAHKGYYNTVQNSQTLYQIMASGLSDSTARAFTCEGYRKDPLQLRTHPECTYVQGANYGRIILEEDNRKKGLKEIKLQLLSGKEANKVLLETKIDPTTCSKKPTKLRKKSQH